MPNSVFRRPVARWAVPATVATAVVGAAVAVPLIAGADSELPDRTAAELLVDLASIDLEPFAGTVVQSAEFGLPELAPVSGAEADSFAAAAMSLLRGSSTARIWYTDGDTYRLALQDELAESDLVRDGEDLWFWSSAHNTASHLTLDEETAAEIEPGTHGPSGLPGLPGGDGEEGLPEGATSVPTAAAAFALQAIAPSTQVDVDGTATVAGRAAYELVVRPRDEQSLIGSIRLAIDGENSMPLRVQIFDRDGGDPAFEVGFTSVTFSEPEASVYDFSPPPGTETEEIDPSELTAPKEQLPPPAGEFDPNAVSVVGGGWSSVAVLRGVDVDEVMTSLDADAVALAESMLSGFEDVSGAYGTGQALTTDLCSVLLLDDGRLLVGAVPLEVLEEAAMDPAAAL
ncbi:LolA family protein [Jiangella gansuensis]|uniref:LolA family protein n=1 Tax=Jiangella gansuensis TaxID=281473 RepID=UPI0004B42754|nr:sigma-E factor regulatory protein RseB domain-containing protein [Jiangella gansuensis]